MTKIVKKASFKELIEKLQTGGSLNRENAARVLGKIKDTRAVEPLIKALKDEEERVRYRAKEALEEIRRTRD